MHRLLMALLLVSLLGGASCGAGAGLDSAGLERSGSGGPHMDPNGGKTGSSGPVMDPNGGKGSSYTACIDPNGKTISETSHLDPNGGSKTVSLKAQWMD